MTKSPLAFQTMEELIQFRQEAIIELMLVDGERRILVQPAFDFVDAPDKKDNQYGRHSATLIMAERRGDDVISTEFFTGWDSEFHPEFGAHDSMMCTGFYFHTHLKKNTPYPQYAHKTEKCGFTGKRCYGEAGSALYGDTIKEVMINRGSIGVWGLFDQAWKEMFKHHE